jgi:hypothetical protein
MNDVKDKDLHHFKNDLIRKFINMIF